MGSFKRPHAFDPLDLEIIDLVYEVAWEHVTAREPSRDVTEDAELQAMLRKRVFALADKGEVEFDALLHSVLAGLSNIITAKPTDGDYV